MKLHNTVDDVAILSNVGEVGEFRIRNSAKAFSILSSGLYANKIRAIIRELSCNAVDSHVAAGKQNTPFDVHLPNAIEPYFSIRDYGTGLSHEQVTNIYTTYFESTKTNSNDFIGALGLGSKSPFSYTDNFTVTAVKDGRKGIYTAFINNQGVPSIALMSESQVSEPNGVEIRFAVEDSFYKFVEEAKEVYRFFKLRPVISGAGNFKFQDPVYRHKDLLPGIHIWEGRSVAVMGNIAYPIEVPNAEQVLGPLHSLLNNLVIEFDIGELDFQASREGLSYIPATIDSIKKKLTLVQLHMDKYLADKVDKASDGYEKCMALLDFSSNFWTQSRCQYYAKNKQKLLPFTNSYGNNVVAMNIDNEILHKSDFNVTCYYNPRSSKNILQKMHFGGFYPEISRGRNENSYFVLNDHNKYDSLSRVKHYFASNNIKFNKVYVIHKKENSTKDFSEFLTMIGNPDNKRVIRISDMPKRPAVSKPKDKNIYVYSLGDSYVSPDKVEFSKLDAKKTYYYLPIERSHIDSESIGVTMEYSDFRFNLRRGSLQIDQVYGVRKNALKYIQSQKNWVNLETKIIESFTTLPENKIMDMVYSMVEFKLDYSYTIIFTEILKKIDDNSLFKKYVKTKNYNSEFESDCKLAMCFDVKFTSTGKTMTDHVTEVKNALKEVVKKYPLLFNRNSHVLLGSDVISEYVNFIDQKEVK
jgi:hypothetical protein